jgi:acyl-coenzyme A thioesterase PaaI-like protein
MNTPAPVNGLLTRAEQALTVPLQHALGARLINPDDPAAGACFEVTGLASNGAGALHSAALDTIIELAGYLAVLPVLAEHEHAITHAISTQLVAAAVDGERVTVRGTLDRRTRHLAFVSVDATVDDRVIARAHLTKTIIDRR